MYGIFTYIYHTNQLNVGKYTIHGSYGILDEIQSPPKRIPWGPPQFFSRQDGRMRRVAENLEAEPPNLGVGSVCLGRISSWISDSMFFQGFGAVGA